MKILILLWLITGGYYHFVNASEHSLIPTPKEFSQGDGSVNLANLDGITINRQEANEVAEYFNRLINPASGLKFTIKQSKSAEENHFNLMIDDAISQAEGYQVSVLISD